MKAMEPRKQVAKEKNSYRLFQAALYPALPYLLYSAQKVKANHPIPPAVSEEFRLNTNIEKARKILILGESTVAGVGAKTTDETLAAHLDRLFQQEYEILNLGKNGIRAKEIWPYFHKKLEKETGHFEGIFLFIGANDCFKLSSPAAYSQSLSRLLSNLKNHFNPNWIFLADIPPIHLFPAFRPVMKYYLKNQRDFLRHQMEELAGKDSDILFKKIKLSLEDDFFCEDRVHPSGKGYFEIAKFCFQGLQQS